MRQRGLPRPVAVAESRELARMLIEAFDRTKSEHCEEVQGVSMRVGGVLVAIGDVEHHTHTIPADGQLDCHELPIRTFDAIDAIGCENGHLSLDELAKAFAYMPADDRRRLIDDLRDPYECVMEHRDRAAGPVIGAIFLGMPVVFLGMTWHPAAAVVAAALPAFLLWKGFGHAYHEHYAGKEIIRLLDEAL